MSTKFQVQDVGHQPAPFQLFKSLWHPFSSQPTSIDWSNYYLSTHYYLPTHDIARILGSSTHTIHNSPSSSSRKFEEQPYTLTIVSRMLVNAIIAWILLAGSGCAQMSMPSQAMGPSMTMAMTMATSAMDPSMKMTTAMTMATLATTAMKMSSISSGTQAGGVSSTTTAESAVTSTNAASGGANSVKDLFASIGLR
ncbi:hypothetical protein VE04_03773 [Pseudogymnoascus sp. 24MN13]|nr:hypothetical protein VE04_03773 [Pseudogymnoascus sp. 24MN13]